MLSYSLKEAAAAAGNVVVVIQSGHNVLVEEWAHLVKAIIIIIIIILIIIISSSSSSRSSRSIMIVIDIHIHIHILIIRPSSGWATRAPWAVTRWRTSWPATSTPRDMYHI